MTKYTSYERETIISFNEEEPTASVYTFNRRLRNKLSKIAKENPDCQIVKESEDYTEFIVPKRWAKVSPLRKMSEENKMKARERAKKMMADKRSDKS